MARNYPQSARGELVRPDASLLDLVDEVRRYDLASARKPRERAGVRVRDIVLEGGLRLHVLQVERPRALLLHAHPGGFVSGAPEMCELDNSELAETLSVSVVSVDYRLAPNYPDPAALNDCVAAAHWLIENGENHMGAPLKLIGGESAGANLMLRTWLRLRDSGLGGAILGASFVAGVFDLSMTPSQFMARDDHFLSPDRLADMRRTAFSNWEVQALRAPEISPLYARLDGAPPAIFTIGEDDSVLDDSVFMAARWIRAQPRTQLDIYPGAPHPFVATDTAMGAAARERIGDFLNACLENA